MSAVAELFVIVVIVIVKAKSPAEFSLPLFSPLFDHQLLSLWKSQIAHTDTCHHISGINLLIQFASFLQINVVHFHPVSHASSSSSSSLLPPITPSFFYSRAKKLLFHKSFPSWHAHIPPIWMTYWLFLSFLCSTNFSLLVCLLFFSFSYRAI